MLIGTLQGPNYFAPSYDESSIEIHGDVKSAIESMLERRASNGRVPVKVAFLNGETTNDLYPVFGEGTSLSLYEVGDSFDPEDEGDVDEALTMVHCGVYDTLISFGEDYVVNVIPYGYDH